MPAPIEPRALEALETMVRIVDKADGREMTNTRNDSFTDAKRTFDLATEGFHADDAYLTDLVTKARTTTSANALRGYGNTIARYVDRYDAIRAADAMRAAMAPAVEGSSSWTASEPSLASVR